MPSPDSSPAQPKHSRLKHPMPLTLGSEQSVKLYKRYFERVDNALYTATKALQLQHREKLAQKNEANIDALIEQFLTELCSTTTTLNQAYQSKRPDGCDSFVYENTSQLKALCSTRYSVKLLNIYEKLDELIGLCAVLEILGQLTPASAVQIVNSWSRRFRQFCSQINEIRTQSFPRKDTKKEPK